MPFCKACGQQIDLSGQPCPFCGETQTAMIEREPEFLPPRIVVEHALRPPTHRPWKVGWTVLLSIAAVVFVTSIGIYAVQLWMAMRQAQPFIDQIESTFSGTKEQQAEAIAMAAQSLKAYGILEVSTASSVTKVGEDTFIVSGRGRTSGRTKKFTVALSFAAWGNKHSWELESVVIDGRTEYEKPTAR